MKAIFRDRHSTSCGHYVLADREGVVTYTCHQTDVDNPDYDHSEELKTIRDSLLDAKNLGIEVFDKSTAKVTTTFKIRQDTIEAIEAEQALLKAIGASIFGAQS